MVFKVPFSLREKNCAPFDKKDLVWNCGWLVVIAEKLIESPLSSSSGSLITLESSSKSCGQKPKHIRGVNELSGLARDWQASRASPRLLQTAAKWNVGLRLPNLGTFQEKPEIWQKILILLC